MQTIQLPGTGLRISRFVFGTASLFNAGARAKRLRLLEVGLEHGFTHFDTAPYYGFGWAERDLGEVLRHYPHATVTTKVGIYPAGGESQPQATVILRKVAGRVLPSASKPEIDFGLARARQALAGSLARLKAESVALYMLHEPELPLLNSDEWQRWLEDEVKQGRVGAFGLALTADRLEPFLAQAPGLARVVQVLDTLDRREADILTRYGRPLQITYGYVSAARTAGSKVPIADTLRAALARNPYGAIIVSTTKADRLPQYAQLLGGAT